MNFIENANFDSPILLITRKRKDSLKKLIRQLKKIKAKKLYIYSDGCKEGQNQICNINKTIKIRKTVLEGINWPCNVQFNFNYSNLGYKFSTISAIDWFFENEKFGIILEDDCNPNKSFFYFCRENLIKYENINIVGCITGVNFQQGRKISKSSYYFSKYNQHWAWATWKNSWELFDKNMKFWPKMKLQRQWEIDKSMSNSERQFWQKIFDRSFNNMNESLAYPWMASLWFNKKITITPESNLVSNIEFYSNVKNINNKLSNYKNIKAIRLKKIIHNNNLNISTDADRFTFKRHFSKKFNPNFFSRIKNILFFLGELFLILRK